MNIIPEPALLFSRTPQSERMINHSNRFNSKDVVHPVNFTVWTRNAFSSSYFTKFKTHNDRTNHTMNWEWEPINDSSGKNREILEYCWEFVDLLRIITKYMIWIKTDQLVGATGKNAFTQKSTKLIIDNSEIYLTCIHFVSWGRTII